LSGFFHTRLQHALRFRSVPTLSTAKQVSAQTKQENEHAAALCFRTLAMIAVFNGNGKQFFFKTNTQI
jgi:hypothetical protein